MSRHLFLLAAYFVVSNSGFLAVCQPCLAQENGKELTKDLYSDPIPGGAYARLGTVRFRQPGVHDIALSPNGKILAASTSQDRSVRLWDMATGTEVCRIKPPFKNPNYPWRVVFSMDSKTLYVGGDGLRRFDVGTGKLLSEFPEYVRVLAMAPDGKTLAVADSGDVRCLDSQTGKIVRTISTRTPQAIAFFPDGKTLAMGFRHDGIRCWDLSTGKQTHYLAPKQDVWEVAVSFDGATLAAGMNTGIRRWRLATGKELPFLPTGSDPLGGAHRVERLTFVPGGKWLVSAIAQNEIQLWDLATDKARFHLRAWPKFAVSTDGVLLAYSFNRGIGFWSIDQQQEIDRGGHHGAITALAFSPDGRTVATGAEDSTVRLWDRQTGKEKARWRLPGQGITGLALSPDGRQAAAAATDGMIRLWDIAGAQESAGLDFRNGLAPYQSWEVSYSPCGKYLLAKGYSAIRLWETATRKELPEIQAAILNAGNPGFQKMALSPDGKTLAACGAASVVFHDISGKGKPLLVDNLEPFNCTQMAFSSDGRMLVRSGILSGASGNPPKTHVLELRESATGELRGQIPYEVAGYTCVSFAFARDGRTLILAPASSQPFPSDLADEVLFWDVEEIGRLKCNQHRVMQVAVSADQRWLATGGDDTTVLIWDLARAPRRKPAERLSPRELNQLWMDLADKDGARAYRAMRKLAAGEKQAVPYMNAILERALKANESARVKALIANLGSEQFKVRQQAQQELEELGAYVEPALQKALEGNPTLEFRQRAEMLLEKMGPARRRLARAVEVLETIASEDARQGLAIMAKGPPEAIVTREAKESLRRLAKKSPTH